MSRPYPADLLTALRASEQRAKLIVQLEGTSTTHYWCTGFIPVTVDLDEDGSDETYLPRAMRPLSVDLKDPGSFTALEIDDTDGLLAQEIINGGLTNRDILVGILLLENTTWLDPYILALGKVESLSIQNHVAKTSIASDVGWNNHSGAAPCALTCTLLFKGDRCGYTGTDTTCNHTWTDCASKGNTARIRAFRRLPQAGQVIRFAKVGVRVESIK